jgi:hypothetical protein
VSNRPTLRVQAPTISVTLLIFALILSLLPASMAGAVNEPITIPDTPTAEYPVVNGTVNAAVTAPDGSTYAAGRFTTANPYVRAYGTTFSDGSTNPDEGPDFNNIVYIAVADGEGGWYVGGDFTQVGGITRNRLAHILPDGSVDSNFDPNVSNGSVSGLALSPDGDTLYTGGTFTTVNGATTRNRLAAFDTSTGTATAFNPNVGGSVQKIALASDGATLYIGGGFSTVNGATARNNVAAFSTSTGTATAFNPNINSFVYDIDLSSDDTTLYVGGYFWTVNGATTRNRLAAFDTATGTATSFNPNVPLIENPPIRDIVLSPDDTVLYAGGDFSTVNGGTARNFLAGFTTTDGTATAFNPNMNQQVASLEISPDGNTLYAGGFFTAVNGGTVRNYFAALNTSTGTATAFDPNPNAFTYALALDGDTLFMGGSFSTFGGEQRNRIVRILADGTVDPDFNPNIGTSTVESLTLTSDGGILYAGGDFTTVNGATTRNRLAAFDATTGTATAFNPNISNGSVDALKLSPDDNILYAGGTFTTVNGATTRNRLAAFDTTTGTATAFDPNIDFTFLNALALTSDGSILYAGGNFTTVNGATTRNRLAAFDTTTGTATAFDPNIGSSSVDTLALTSDDATLYVGGSFTTVNGATTRNRLAAFDTSTGTATAFDPNMSGQVVTLALASDTIYAGGSFTTVNGATTRNRLAAFDTSTGTATAFDPNVGASTVHALAFAADGATLFAGGTFALVGNEAHPFFASFHESDVDGDGISNDIEQAAPNDGDANNDGTPDAQQSHVHSAINPVTNEYAVLEADEQCTITDFSLEGESSNSAQDDDYSYPAGMMDFTLDCGSNGFTATINHYYYGETGDYSLRKYNPTTDAYATIEGAVMTAMTIGGQNAIQANYQVTDGGELDIDGVVNGVIEDPAGLAVLGESSESESLADTGSDMWLVYGVAILLVGGSVVLHRKDMSFLRRP